MLGIKAQHRVWDVVVSAAACSFLGCVSRPPHLVQPIPCLHPQRAYWWLVLLECQLFLLPALRLGTNSPALFEPRLLMQYRECALRHVRNSFSLTVQTYHWQYGP